jgi:hypothetical protein
MHRSPPADRLIWCMRLGRPVVGLASASLLIAGVIAGAMPGLLAQQTGSGASTGISHMGVVGIRSPAFSGAPRIAPPPAVLPSPAHRESNQAGSNQAGSSQAGSNQAAPVGRAGHWPSWEGGVRPGNGVRAGNGEHPENGHGGNEHRTHGREGYPYVYPGLLSFGYGLPVGNGVPAGYDEGGVSGTAADPANADGHENAGAAPDPQMAENATPLYRPLYQGPASPIAGGQGAGASSAERVHAQPATTLIFKDGRAHELVHNYALTGTTLWALDGETRREIPLDTLDLPATVRANREAGVDFGLPSSR